MEPAPWSNNQLRRLGRLIRDGEVSSAFAPSYNEVELRYSELASEVQQRLQRIDWRGTLGRREFEVTARAKTIDTLRDKLLRDRSTPLSNVQDIAGVRFEAEMTLSQQDEVARLIVEEFQQTQVDAIHDLRGAPRSGYRAVHVWLRLPERVEVQIRTRLQSAWANAYEELGDLVGREIRYGGLPQDARMREFVLNLQTLSIEDLRMLETDKDRFLQTRMIERRGSFGGSDADDHVARHAWEAWRQSELDVIEALEKLQSGLSKLRGSIGEERHDWFSH